LNRSASSHPGAVTSWNEKASSSQSSSAPILCRRKRNAIATMPAAERRKQPFVCRLEAGRPPFDVSPMRSGDIGSLIS